ncbi:MAG: TetR/AcrR family transcriptional regulator [Hydrogenophaga sp.]|jgi:AcrR family transcriptional regulator|nr:TetR/AcrR family transcriptional regulator [Hydrogenophaga sp.]
MSAAETDSTVMVEPSHRTRLLQAMAAVTAEKGFADTTIADLVREAGVSKRTFYEHFDSKEACFLALYQAASDAALRALTASLLPDRPWQPQMEHGLRTYFAHLAAAPSLVRTLFVVIIQLGPEGMRVRRGVMNQLADFLLSMSGEEGSTSGLTPAMALAAVGAINELVLQAIEANRVAELTSITADAAEVVRSLTQAQRF